MAKQAAGAAVVTYADTMVLVAVSDGEPREGLDFFPLTVDYREKGYAAGLIFGGRFRKREGAPNKKEILTMRCIDRPVRPLWPSGYHRDILISAFTLSADKENDPDVAAMVGASACLTVSELPFQGPTGTVRMGLVDGEVIVNPTYEQRTEGDLDLIVTGRKGSIVMVEAGAKEVPEDKMLEAIAEAQKAIDEIVAMQEELAAAAGKPKLEIEAPDTSFADTVKEKALPDVRKALAAEGKAAKKDGMVAIYEKLKKELCDEEDPKAPTKKMVRSGMDAAEKVVVREAILSGKRIDGRPLDEVRPIESEVALLPRVHGSALFTRGETQALVATTLGSAADKQYNEGLLGEFTNEFLMHYNFPSFSVGEVRMPRGPSRREIGHGALAERALESVLPKGEDFPYVVRLVSDVLESNGSSSMATVCGGTLALMDAGVPIKDPVAGVAMGLVKDGENVCVLTDIVGAEDHFGDMDFKVAGTQNGITALQMDVKIDGVSAELLKGAMEQAKEARIHILRQMLQTLEAPRPKVSPYAPRIITVMIPVDKIGKLIGPGGKTINGIAERTGASINVEDDGQVSIAAESTEKAEAAKAEVDKLFEVPEVGKVYRGEVKSVKDFGAFVQILPGTDGLVHISELAEGYVKNVSDVIKLGDVVDVKLISIDDLGRLKLSIKALTKSRD